MTLEEAIPIVEHMRTRKIERAAEVRADAEKFRAIEPAQESYVRAAYVRDCIARCDSYADKIERECEAVRLVLGHLGRLRTFAAMKATLAELANQIEAEGEAA